MKKISTAAAKATKKFSQPKLTIVRECGWKHGVSGYSAGEKTLSQKKNKEFT